MSGHGARNATGEGAGSQMDVLIPALTIFFCKLVKTDNKEVSETAKKFLDNIWTPLTQERGIGHEEICEWAANTEGELTYNTTTDGLLAGGKRQKQRTRRRTKRRSKHSLKRRAGSKSKSKRN